MAGVAFILAAFLVNIGNGAKIKDLPNFNITQIEPRAGIERSLNQSVDIEPRSDPLLCYDAIAEGLEHISSADPFIFKPTAIGCTVSILVLPNTEVHVDVMQYDHNSGNYIEYYWKWDEASNSNWLFGGEGSSFSISPINFGYILEIHFDGSNEGAIDGFEVHVYSLEDEEPETTPAPPITEGTLLKCRRKAVRGVEDKTATDPFVFKPSKIPCEVNIRVKKNTAIFVDVISYNFDSSNTIAFYRRVKRGEYEWLDFEDGQSFELVPQRRTYVLNIDFFGMDATDLDGFEVHIYAIGSESTTTTTSMPDTTDASTSMTTSEPETTPSSMPSTTASTTPSTTPSSTAAPTTPSSGTYCDKCGLTLDNRIVGGIDAEQNEFPWQVGLVGRGSTFIFCGGTLISSEYVLTAAHCLDGSQLDVILGGHSRNTADSGQQTVQVERIISHEAYNTQTLVNDIAVLKLATPVTMTRAMNVACLPMQKIVNAGDSVTATGWGTTSSGGGFPAVLQEVTVPALSTSQCRQSYGGVSDNHVCAGLAEGGKDSCQGDSGGPLIVRDSTESRGFVVGITSYGIGCAQPNYPGVYTRVSAYLDWISENTAGTTLCSRQF